MSLSLLACGSNSAADGDDDNITGADWRTWGIINEYGVIKRQDEEIRVCVCINNSEANIYYDDAEQVIFASVEYPETIEDEESYYSFVGFEDIDGDGCGDIEIDFSLKDGSKINMVWLWNEENGGFDFSQELSK